VVLRKNAACRPDATARTAASTPSLGPFPTDVTKVLLLGSTSWT
jgi:hypothetical protein